MLSLIGNSVLTLPLWWLLFGVFPTQGKKVEDNVKTAAKGAAVVGKKRQYRQYMNRRGGFGGGGGGSSRGGR